MVVGPQAPERASILGVPVDLVTRSAVESWLRTVVTGEGTTTCRHLVTLNPEYVMAAARDHAFGVALRHADLATPDGVGVMVAVRWLSPAFAQRVPFHRVTGVDIVEMLASVSAAEGVPIFLLGAGRGVADAAATRLSERFPGFVSAGSWDGGTPGTADDGESRARIEHSGARVVLVAYGAPGQIHWIARNQRALGEAGVNLVVGVGGALDFVSGAVRRAPPWVRRAGLEWLYRLVREPWRWRRQMVLPLFAWRVAVMALRNRLQSGSRTTPDV